MRSSSLAVLSLFLGRAVAQDAALVASEARFEAAWAHIMPAAGELRWQAIPWRAVLADAVVEAHRADKPVLLWAMNGHPLGCT